VVFFSTAAPRQGHFAFRDATKAGSSVHFPAERTCAMVMANPQHELAFSIRQGFVRMLPDLRGLLRWIFRGENPDQRSEMVSEAIAFSFAMYKRAREAGKDVDLRPLARYSSLHVMSGARFAGSNRRDVTCTRWRKPRAHKQVSPFSQLPPENTEFLLPDRRAHWPVPDQAAFRIDWSEFTSRCSRQNRLIMRLLAAGYRRNEVARRLRITPPAITQRMQAVRNRWQAFQAS